MSLTVSGSETGLDWVDVNKKKSCIGKMKEWVFDPTIPSFAHTVGGLTRAVKGAVEPFFEMATNVHAGIGGTQFTAAVLMPFGLYELACEVADLFKKETLEGKLDSFLNVVGGIGDGADGIVNITEGLVSVGAVSAESAAWAGPLGMAAAAISAIFVVVHAKAIYSNYSALKGIKKSIKKADVPIADVLIKKLNKESYKYRLEGSSGVDVSKLIHKINEVKNEVNVEAKIKKIYKGLKTRIKEKQACHALGIVITVIGIVASAILFATALTPAVVAAFVLLAGLYVLCMSKIGVGIYSERKFEQLLANPIVIKKPSDIALG